VIVSQIEKVQEGKYLHPKVGKRNQKGSHACLKREVLPGMAGGKNKKDNKKKATDLVWGFLMDGGWQKRLGETEEYSRDTKKKRRTMEKRPGRKTRQNLR